MPFQNDAQRKAVMSMMKKRARGYGRVGAVVGGIYGGVVGGVLRGPLGAVGGAAAGAVQGYLHGRIGGMGYEKWKYASTEKRGRAPGRGKKTTAAILAGAMPLLGWGYGTMKTRRGKMGPR
jgi:uncharacterized protein YcfJ